jgi:lysophospholipase L1-like esterase
MSTPEQSYSNQITSYRRIIAPLLASGALFLGSCRVDNLPLTPDQPAAEATTTTTLSPTTTSEESSPTLTTDTTTSTTVEVLVEPLHGRVDIHGDSIVAGYHMNGMRWTDMLTLQLNSTEEFSGIAINNFAVPAQTIQSEAPVWMAPDNVQLGGSLTDKILAMYPKNSTEPRPDAVIVVPSINEFVLTQQTTDDEKIAYAIQGLQNIKAYLNSIGITNVVFTNMLSGTPYFDGRFPTDYNRLVAMFNSSLAQSGLDVLPGMDLDDNDDGIADDTYFTDPTTGSYDLDDAVYNDGLHPNAAGHVSIKDRIITSLEQYLRNHLR